MIVMVYACVCPVDYTGVHCEIYVQIDDCDGVNCGNGTCQDLVGGYTCLCLTGYTGNNCEIQLENCEKLQYLNTTSNECIDLSNGKRQLILL